MPINIAPIVSASQFPGLNVLEDRSREGAGISSLGRSISDALRTVGQQKREDQLLQDQLDRVEEEKQAQLLITQDKDDEAKFGLGLDAIRNIGGGKTAQDRSNNFQRQKKQLAQMAQQFSGDDLAIFQDLLDIEDPDQLNVRLTQEVLSSGDAQESLAQVQKQLISQETFTTIFDELGNPTGQQGNLSGKVIADPRAPSDPQFALGTGDMAGFVINKGTGEVTEVAPQIRANLDAEAQRIAAAEGMLDTKDFLGVNKEITAITKPVIEIHAAAQSLAALEENSSPAAQIAAVFKFMKALDPTSTVRESELGLVYSAEGAAQGMANKLNQILGEGALSGPGFLDLVNTSNILANSAVDATNRTVANFIQPFADKVTPEQAANLQARVPQRLGSEAPPTPTVLNQTTPEALATDPTLRQQALNEALQNGTIVLDPDTGLYRATGAQ